jgi:hypothetical protein
MIASPANTSTAHDGSGTGLKMNGEIESLSL